jgi:hypothetical protein
VSDQTRDQWLSRQAQVLVVKATVIHRAAAQLTADGMPAEQAERMACQAAMIEAVADDVSSYVGCALKEALGTNAPYYSQLVIAIQDAVRERGTR